MESNYELLYNSKDDEFPVCMDPLASISQILKYVPNIQICYVSPVFFYPGTKC